MFGLYLIGYGDPACLESVGLSLVALCFGGVLVLLLSEPPKWLMAALNSRILVWIGKLSYSLYLWHLYAFFVVELSRIDRKYVTVLSLPLAFLFAAFSYYWIERPFLRLKRRYAVVS